MFKILRAYFPLIISLLALCAIEPPRILSSWESLYFYSLYGAENSPIEFPISPRANIGDPGYWTLDISRLLIEFIGLNIHLNSIRIIAIFYGIVTALIFFEVCCEYTSKNVAIITAILLSINPIFFTAEHTFTVLIISGAVFMLFILCSIKLEKNKNSILFWLFYTISLFLLISHYGVGRILGFCYLFYSIIKIYINGENRKLILYLFLSFSTVIISIIFINYHYYGYLTNPIRIIIPGNGEIPLINREYREVSLGLFDTIIENYKILITLIGINTKYYINRFLVDVYSDFRFPIINLFGLLFAFLGFIIGLFKIYKNNIKKNSEYYDLLVIFFLSLLPIIFSLVASIDGIKINTVSNFRSFYLLFPLYLYIAIFFDYIYTKKLAYKFLIYILGSIIFIISFLNIKESNLYFRERISNLDPSLFGASAYAYWGGEFNSDRPISLYSHFQQHAQYIHAASRINDLYQSKAIPGQTLIIRVDLNQFNESLLKPESLGVMSNLNYHAPFLALYVSKSNLNAGWVLVVDSSVKGKSLGFYRPRIYSAPLSLNSGKLIYSLNSDSIISYEVKFGFSSSRPDIVITTTPEEYVFAQKWLIGNGITYATYSLDK